MPTEPLHTRRVGWDSLLLEVDDPPAWFRALVRARESGRLSCEDIVPAACTVLLKGLRGVPNLAQLTLEPPAGNDLPIVEVPVSWNGPDYAGVAQRWGDDPATVLKSTQLTVAFCGFVPGFAYLAGLPDRYHVPRLETPRKAVPRGSVAVAGAYAGIYPRSSPGGWRLLGRTDVELFDLHREQPARLEPGMRVKVVDA